MYSPSLRKDLMESSTTSSENSESSEVSENSSIRTSEKSYVSMYLDEQERSSNFTSISVCSRLEFTFSLLVFH